MSALASCVRVRSKSVVRFAVTAIELLTRTAGAYACEAALGWVDLPELSEEVILAAQAKAASLGPRMTQRGGQGGLAPGTAATAAKGEAGAQSASRPWHACWGRSQPNVHMQYASSGTVTICIVISITHLLADDNACNSNELKCDSAGLSKSLLSHDKRLAIW